MKCCPHCQCRLEPTFAYCPACAQAVEVERVPAASDSDGRTPFLERAMVLGAVLFAAALVAAPLGIVPEWDLTRLRGAAPGADELMLEPVHAEPERFVLDLVDAELYEMSAGEYFDTPFEIDDPRQCTLSGEVEGVAGGDRDVEVYVLDELGFQDWRDGVRPDALFASGRATTAYMQVELPSPGRYHLLLSNRYSLFTGKQVRVQDARVVCG